MKYMLDTNICIYLIKNKPAKVLEHFKEVDIENICISSVVLSELMYGVEKSMLKEQNLSAIEKFIENIDVLPYEDKDAMVYGKVRYELEKMGLPIGAYDMMIASHAMSNNLTLVTNNLKEFSNIKNLKVENWA